VTRGVPHPAELRAEAVAAVLAGARMADVARQYGVSKGTLGTWLAEDESIRTVRTEQHTREERLDAVEDLLFDLVAEHAKTLTAELQFATRAEWLEKLSAAELAQLVGAQKETLIRLLVGLFGNHTQSEPGTAGVDAPALPDPAR
jgi:transposase-like protein